MSDIDSNYDPFIANTVYPDAEAIFSRSIQSLIEIKDNAIVVLDTNALLIPFTVGKESLDKIRETYSKLANENRLFIPGQVAREFAKNRANKLGELLHQFNEMMNKAGNYKQEKYPLLEGIPEYEQLTKMQEDLKKSSDEYRKAVKSVLHLIKNWSWNDPVSRIYASLFKGRVVVDLDVSKKEEILKDFQHRKLHKLPPGYKDSSKDDEGIGDYLIWLTILELAKTQKKNAIFVTGEEKPDWWHRSSGQTLYPRYELIDEYYRNSENNTFHIISFSEFLELYDANEEIVEEIGMLESKASEKKLLHTRAKKDKEEFLILWKELRANLENLCYKYLTRDSSGKPIIPLNLEVGMKGGDIEDVVDFLQELNVINGPIATRIKKLQRFRAKIIQTRDYSRNEIMINKSFLENAIRYLDNCL